MSLAQPAIMLPERAWKSLERSSSTAFLIAGLMFVVADTTVVAVLITDTESSILMGGQAFIAAGWTAALTGLLGLYPGLADRSRRLAQASAVFAVIGVLTFAVMAVGSLVYFTGVLSGDPSTFVPVLLPGVVIGSLLAFVSTSIASLRTNAGSRAVGAFLLVPSVIFVLNVSSPNSPEILLFIDSGLALAMLSIGYLLRRESRLADTDDETSLSDPSAQ